MTQELPDDAVFTTTDSSPPVYHTNPECPHYPDDVRPAEDWDRRRGVRWCGWCQGQWVPTLEG